MLRHRKDRPFRSAVLAIAAVAGMAGGCTPTRDRAAPEPTLEAIDAIETRRIAAPPDAVLRAASTVLLDEGYLYAMSDHAAGLISGFRLHNNTMDSQYFARTGGMGRVIGCAGCCADAPIPLCDSATCTAYPSLTSNSICVWVRPVDRGQSLVRINTWVDQGRTLREREVTRFASLIEQRLIATTPGAQTRQATGGPR